MKNAHFCSFGALEFTENPPFSVNWATVHIFQNISRSIGFTIKPFEMWGHQMYTPRRFFCFGNILHEKIFKSTKHCVTSRFWELCPKHHNTGILNSWICHRTTKGGSNRQKIILKQFLWFRKAAPTLEHKLRVKEVGYKQKWNRIYTVRSSK